MNKYIAITLLCFGLIGSMHCSAQTDSITHVCSKYMKLPFISDGQQYQTIIGKDETAEFHVSFFAGGIYRIVGCSGISERNLIFTVYDTQHNKIFTNKDFSNAPYWDFKFKSTMDCIVEAQLASQKVESGFAIIMVGFKQ